MSARPSVGRNDPCLCGSGKKYKKCCGQTVGLPGSVGAIGAMTGSGAQSLPAAQVTDAEVEQLAALMGAGRFAELERAARQLITRVPRAGIAWKALGIGLWMQGKEAQEALEEASTLLPQDAQVHSDLGTVLRKQGKHAEAERWFRRALIIDPAFAEAHNNLGGALQDQGRIEEAIASYRRALALKADFAAAHLNLGDLLHLRRSLAEAAASYRAALALEPTNAEAHGKLALTLRLQGENAAAEASCRQALEIDPNLTAAINALAHVCADRGEFAEAESLFRRTIALEPDCAEAWAGIPSLRKMTREDADWVDGAQRVCAQGLAPAQEANLRYALGKYFDDVRDYRAAFASYRRANELAKSCRPAHDRTDTERAVDRIIDRYDRVWLARERPRANPSSRPVFIVGMPRSGTTLLEQILASHPAVFGAGEVSYWTHASAKHAAAMADADRSEQLLRALADEYMQLMERKSPDAHKIVDKLPGNFRCIGLLHAAFPNARFIHMCRDPIDTCLSIYFQNFHDAHTYANDLGDLAHYFGHYLRLMRHWHSLVPAGTILDVPYEELTRDPEVWSRKALEFLGLPWDPACLNFADNDRTILTCSRWQARQKITRASVARWRNYEEFIGPLLSLPAR